RLLGRAARRIALDDEQLGALRGCIGAIGQLAGQAQLARRALALRFLFLAAADALVGALDHPVEQPVRLRWVAGEPVIDIVFDRLFGDALRLDGREPVLGLTLNLRL